MNLPEPPKPAHRGWIYEERQMQEYGRLCAEAMRNECIEVCEDKHYHWRWDNSEASASGPRDCIAGIRQLEIE